MTVDPPINIDIYDKSTWVAPVDVRKKRTLGANVYWVEYSVPISLSAIIMAIAQLPSYVPRDVRGFPRIYMTPSNIARDGRHRGTFAVEVSWPLNGALDDPWPED